jgi:hypothetical protein
VPWKTAARLLVFFGFAALLLAMDRGVVDPELNRAEFGGSHLVYGGAIALPFFLFGLIVGRWWAAAIGLLALVTPLLPERCEVHYGGDFVDRSCSSATFGIAVPAAAIVVLVVLAGVATATLGAALWRRRARRSVAHAAA